MSLFAKFSKLFAIDEDLSALLVKRKEVVSELHAQGYSLDEVLEWEAHAAKRLVRSLPADMPHETVTEVLNCVWSYARPNLVTDEPSVACLGPTGTFSHIAALRLFSGKAEFKLMSDPRGIIESVVRHPNSYGVISIKNSNSGAIPENLELLDVAFDSGVRIIESVNVLVELSLMGKGSLSEINTILSHSQAISQCRWQIEQLQRSRCGDSVRIMETTSTADAARIVGGDSSSSMGAIVHRSIGEAYGLKALVDPFEDHLGTTTNFVLLASGRSTSPPSGRDLTSLVFKLRAPDLPGTLLQALQPLSTFNLSVVQSWIPQGSASGIGSDGNCMFFVELEGHPEVSRIGRSIDSMRMTCADGYPKVLGTFVRPEGCVGATQRNPLFRM